MRCNPGRPQRIYARKEVEAVADSEYESHDAGLPEKRRAAAAEQRLFLKLCGSVYLRWLSVALGFGCVFRIRGDDVFFGCPGR